MLVREKLQAYGAEKTLSDAEIIAALLGRETGLTIADISARNFEKLTTAQKTIIRAALELSARVVALRNDSRKITSSRDSFSAVSPHLCNLDVERFCIVLLNRANKIIRIETISVGGATGTVVDPRAVARLAILNNASSVIIAHNHPSGNTKPSQADINITRKTAEALKCIDCILLDHIIYCGETQYYSFADNDNI